MNPAYRRPKPLRSAGLILATRVLLVRFQKARGLTASEQLLAELCEKSFLSLWSYPNLYRRQGKELTDLLVVFGDDVILFSDKSCTFPDTDDAALDWKRWFRRSIADSAKQIHQAEQWIRRQPERVFLDVKATQPLPVPLPPLDRLRIHPRGRRDLHGLSRPALEGQNWMLIALAIMLVLIVIFWRSRR